MDALERFKLAVRERRAEGLGPGLLALYHDALGDWRQAHELAQNMPGRDGAWIHAYLHRKEGDLGNADYWYRRADRRRPELDLAAEWDQIAAALLAQEQIAP